LPQIQPDIRNPLYGIDDLRKGIFNLKKQVQKIYYIENC